MDTNATPEASTVAPSVRTPINAYDLTAKLTKYLDPHLSLQMVSFIEDKNVGCKHHTTHPTL